MKLYKQQFSKIKTAQKAFEKHVQEITEKPVVANYKMSANTNQGCRPPADAIIGAACHEMQISVEEFYSKHRQRKIVDARRIAIKLLRSFYPALTLKGISAVVKNYDHTVVIYHLHQWENLMAVEPVFAEHHRRTVASLHKIYKINELSVQAELQARSQEPKSA